MEQDREKLVLEIKRRVQSGRYDVDPQLVADAIVRRLTQIKLTRNAQSPLAAPRRGRS